MTQFFMHLRHGNEFVEDLEGADYDGLEQACQDAICAAREIMADRLRQGRPLDGDRFEIADETGQTLAVIHFHDAIPAE